MDQKCVLKLKPENKEKDMIIFNVPNNSGISANYLAKTYNRQDMKTYLHTADATERSNKMRERLQKKLANKK